MTDVPPTRREFLTLTAGGVLGAYLSRESAGAVQTGAGGLTVYVGGYDGTLYAVDASSGEQVWAFEEPSGAVDSSPTVVDGTVFVGGDDGTLYAVDASSGEQVWAFEEPSGAVDSSPTVVDGTAFVGSDDGTLYAVDVDSGDQEWTYDGASDEVNSSPTVADGTLYVGGDDTLYAVDAATGTQKWGFYDPSEVLVSSPTVADESVFVGSWDNTLYAVDADSGDQRWAFERPTGAIDSSPTVVDGTVYVGCQDSRLYAVDAESGDQEWRFTNSAFGMFSSPTVANELVYIGSQDNTLYAVDATYGTEEWAFAQPSDLIASSPTVVEGTVYVGSNDGSLYAVDADSGTQEWAFTEPSDAVFASPTVVKYPEDGNSIGSRVLSGTLGHHDDLHAGQRLTLSPSFDISIEETNAPVAPGSELTVTATVENTSDVPDTQTLTLSVSDIGTDGSEISLEGGESTTVTFSIETEPDDADDYLATVTSENDSVSEEVTVLSSAIFAVDIVDVVEPSPDAAIEVTVAVENTGGAADTQTISVTIPDIGSKEREISLDGSASTTETFSISISPDQYGEHPVVVESEDDTAEGTALAAALFAVDVVEGTEPVAGEPVAVTVTVENRGNRFESQTISLSIPGLGEDDREISLAGGVSTTETLSIATGTDDVGEYTATVETDDDSVSTDLRVLAPARFVIDDIEVTETVAGDSVEVTVTVENTGAVADTQSLTLSVPELGEDQREIALDGGDSTSKTLSVATDEGDAGEYTATLESENDSTSDDLRVLEPAQFAVEVVDVTESVAGETVEVTVTVENTGAVADTQSVTVSIPELGEDQREVALDGGDSTSKTFSIETAEADDGAYTASVRSADEERSLSITVSEPVETATAAEPSDADESDDGFGPSSMLNTRTGLGIAALGTTTLVGGMAYRYLRATGGSAISTELGLVAWTQHGRTHHRTGANATVPAPEREPEIAWTTDAPGRGVAVAEGVVVTATNSQLIARTLESGVEEWFVDFARPDDGGSGGRGNRATGAASVTVGAPAIAHGTVVVTVDNVLRVFDLTEGYQLWEHALPAQPSAPPLMVENSCYVVTPESVHAIELSGGFQQWETDIAGTAALAATRNRLFVVGQDVVCLDPADAGERWRTDHDCGRALALACDNDGVLVSGTQGVSCFDAGTGASNWTADVGSNTPGIALTDDRVYLTTSGGVSALSRTNGSQIWIQPLDASTAPTCVGGAVFVGTPVGLVALNAQDGTQYWAQELDGQATAQPRVVGNGILVETSVGCIAIAGELVEAPTASTTGERRTGQRPSAGVTPGPTSGQAPPSKPGPSASLDTAEALSDLTQLSEAGPLVTYYAGHADIDERVRVVALASDVSPTDGIRDAFRQTAQGWRNGSSHPNVCSIHDWGLEPRPWIAMDTPDGKRLTECMATLSNDDVVSVIADVADAVRNVALYNANHLNLTPAAVWVVEDGTELSGVVEDWGLGRAVREANDDQHVTSYTAPEQLDGDRTDKRTDVYGLAAVAYHALTGDPPVEPDADAIRAGDIPPPSEVGNVPERLDDHLLRGLAASPDERFTTPLDFGRRLRNAW